MRRVFLHINVSLDGFIEDKDQEIDWHFVDDEFEEYINEVLCSIDGMMFGRKAHQLLSQYWPTAASRPDASPRHLEAARMMNSLPKYVISGGGYQTQWQNSHIISGDIPAHIQGLKSEPGKDLALFAGAEVARSFIRMDLLDEYRIVVNPVLLGGGTPLFEAGQEKIGLTQVDTRAFRSGAVVLFYEPAARANAISASGFPERAAAHGPVDLASPQSLPGGTHALL